MAVPDETQKIQFVTEGAPQPSVVSSSSKTNNEATKSSENDDNVFTTNGDDASVQQIAETKRNLLWGSLGEKFIASSLQWRFTTHLLTP